MISLVSPYDLPAPPVLQKEAFFKKMREIIRLNHPRAKKKEIIKKKKVAQDGLTLWSPYPSRSAKRSVFGQQKGILWSTFFGPKKAKVDHKLGPLDGLTLWSP